MGLASVTRYLHEPQPQVIRHRQASVGGCVLGDETDPGQLRRAGRRQAAKNLNHPRRRPSRPVARCSRVVWPDEVEPRPERPPAPVAESDREAAVEALQRAAGDLHHKRTLVCADGAQNEPRD
jgi:hypothetical protein